MWEVRYAQKSNFAATLKTVLPNLAHICSPIKKNNYADQRRNKPMYAHLWCIMRFLQEHAKRIKSNFYSSTAVFGKSCKRGLGAPETCFLEDLGLRMSDLEPFGFEQVWNFFFFLFSLHLNSRFVMNSKRPSQCPSRSIELFLIWLIFWKCANWLRGNKKDGWNCIVLEVTKIFNRV